MTPGRSPVGQVTRGTTGTNRLRRVDRWIARHPALRRAADPLVVDLGFGASAVTALELAARLARVRPDVEVLGLEIDPQRVARARSQLSQVRAGTTGFAADTRVSFALGGFEVPTPEHRRPAVIRAMNVLRQYDEPDVRGAWQRMAATLATDGLLVEGTCDELGRVCTWIAIGPDAAPRTLTVALRLAGLERPSIAAERLPKALIHRNVPGERVHDLLRALDDEWDRAASVAAFGPVQRWEAALRALRNGGWPVRDRSRWRLGELTVPWSAVAPG
ncbi:MULTISPECIES: class I SAM-dependent methyltransferase [unclassified Microbacterium]|uniref:class I SAM-dependent methyltransferase n=1 Tax=unclassified Microbacterium TaxID=2609290 RepID=UPI00214CC033|nr:MULTISPECIES: class I SAM-dependent methyltransferase [unclassified Microbacterium]MCR2810742.1 class I SAM-dependent methyltransferase [Microbacterium sp. zg.B185]WIM18277.1 class I SAM-dependent methyltransferase [Microbacterium sp. zg-B185]